MARPKLQPPSLTYPEWIAAGRPSLALSTQQLAEWLVPPISKQRINDLCKQGALFRDGSKILTDQARNAAWLLNREGTEPAHKPVGRWVHPGGVKPPPAVRPPAVDYDTTSLDLEVVLEAISQQDLSMFKSADIKKARDLESALKTRVEREQKRGLLIERSLVQTVFGRLYQLDSNQFKTLGAKLAPELAGQFGIEDPAALLKVEALIDAEVLKILSHIKRLLDDFLVGVGGEAV